MKCITNGKDYRRVSDSKASQMVAQGYQYMPKGAWKKATGRVREEDEPVVKASKKAGKQFRGKKAEKAEAKAEAKAAKADTKAADKKTIA